MSLGQGTLVPTEGGGSNQKAFAFEVPGAAAPSGRGDRGSSVGDRQRRSDRSVTLDGSELNTSRGVMTGAASGIDAAQQQQQQWLAAMAMQQQTQMFVNGQHQQHQQRLFRGAMRGGTGTRGRGEGSRQGTNGDEMMSHSWSHHGHGSRFLASKFEGANSPTGGSTAGTFDIRTTGLDPTYIATAAAIAR